MNIKDILFVSDSMKIKLYSTCANILLIFSVFILVNTKSVENYEVSLYAIYPWYFWLSVILTIIVGNLAIYKYIISPELKNDNSWIYGLLAVIISNSMLILMPIIRGYYVYGREDVLSHIGYILDIFNSSDISGNYYPIIHILAVIISFIANLNIYKLVVIIPFFYFSLYFVFNYHLIKILSSSTSELLFILIFCTFIYFQNGTTFAPSIDAFYLFPMILYLFFKSKFIPSSSFAILLVISLFNLVYTHPLTTISLIGVFFIIEIVNYFYNKGRLSSFNAILICTVTFCSWYFSFHSILTKFNLVLNTLFSPETSNFQDYSSVLSRANPTVSLFLDVMLRMYSMHLIIAFFGSIFSVFFIYLYIKRQNRNFVAVLFSICFLFFEFLSVICFFGNFVVDFWRVFKYCFFWGAYVIGLGFYYLISLNGVSPKLKKINYSYVLILLLIMIPIISVFSLHLSPVIKSESQQVSETEATGFKWLFSFKNKEILIKEMGPSQRRFADLIFGRSGHTFLEYSGRAKIPYHFGYEKHKKASDSYNDSVYFVYSAQNVGSSARLYPTMEKAWRFKTEDFFQLDKDESAFKIYTDSGLNIYYIYKGGNYENIN